jgi:hypothetical protein
VLERVLVALGRPASGSMHTTDPSPPHRRRSALLPAPLRSGAASQRLVHR